MKLEEVIPALREGKSIRRAEWGEDCHVKREDSTSLQSQSEYKSHYIFYFCGSDYEEWKPSMVEVTADDWEVKEVEKWGVDTTLIPSSGHSWIWALYEMREGKSVRRKAWRKGVSIQIREDKIVYGGKEAPFYDPTIKSMLAEDWEVVE